MSIYESLNPQQQEAVYHTEGPLLILAGAGSGKTRVLTHRVGYLIAEKGVKPWNILAITFTNKAAAQMRERVDQIAGADAQDVWVSTFHAACVRILRRYADRLGYDRNFTIYDSDDQKNVIKEVCKRLNIDTKIYKERSLIGAISTAKNELHTPLDMARSAAGKDYGKEILARVYTEYQKTLLGSNAMDFDDLIGNTVRLLETDEEARDYYQERFRYIMVDEYQDTNTAQFRLVSCLAEKYRNLCVVGDDDQSIYKFRGANIHNILDFEDAYPDAHVIRLEQNYRSTKTILAAANAVIANNTSRKEKTLWTMNAQGDRIEFRQYDSEYEEASGVVKSIAAVCRDGKAAYQDCAVLYRTNAQSRVLEEKFVYAGIPYRIVGGQNFYARKEIKDILAYLKTIVNGQDDLSVRRILNVPKRGIGAVSLSRVDAFAAEQEISFFEALKRAGEVPSLSKSAVEKITGFTNLIEVLRANADMMTLTDSFDFLLSESGYEKELEKEQTEEARGRLDNIDELRNKVVVYEEAHEKPAWSEFLEEVSLVADIDTLDESENRVVLMTLHSAKGLEFPYVYMTGMEEGLFPGYMSIYSDAPKDELEEERRLCYVGITRAKEHLTLTCAHNRMVHGSTQNNRISRFVLEIPEELLQGGRRTRTVYGRQTADTGSYADGNVHDAYGTNGLSGGRSNLVPFNKDKKQSLDDLLASNQVVKGSSMFQKPSQSRAKRSVYPQLYGGKLSSDAGRKQTKDAAKVQAAGTGGLAAPDYGPGDRVRHAKFGEGTVLEVVPIKGDYQVQIDFGESGIRKLRVSYSYISKLED